MDEIKLKKYAELLEVEIKKNLGNSSDVDWLDQYPTLVEAISDAKAGRVNQPRDLGLTRWIFESYIQSFDILTERLMQFETLLRGLDLKSENISR